PTFITNEQLTEQRDFYLQIQDPNIRSRIVKSFYQCENPSMEKVLTLMAEKEKDPIVLSDILHAFYTKSLKFSNIPLLKEMMKSEIPSLRGYSAYLYLDSASSTDDVFDFLKREQDEFVARIVWNKLSSLRKDLCKKDKLNSLINNIPSFQKQFVLALLTDITEKPDEEILIIETLKKGTIEEKISIAGALARRTDAGHSLLAKLSEDPDTRIRHTVAGSKFSTERLSYLLKLASDPVPAIRYLAVKSLSESPSLPDAVNAIISRLGDEDYLVRTEAENGLIALNIGDEYLSKVLDKLNDNNATASAIRVLGELKYQPSAEKIRKIILETNIPEIRRRSAIALGRLKYKEAADEIAKFAKDNDKSVRTAVAYALGQIKVQNTFNIIADLALDKEPEVSAEASMAIYEIGDSFFIKTIVENLKRVKENYLIRSAAVKAASAQITAPNEIVKALKKAALEKTIPTEMGPVFDMDQVRGGAAWALVEITKKNKDIIEETKQVLKMLQTPPEKQDDRFVSSEFLIDCAKQAQAYMEDKEPTQSEITPSSPVLIIRKIKGE
ncbi:MAG TPA: HEAT repeat domain-containing protein, partial [Victivallales bacterium]|nr:HEAT repeat domain-containing protein [Victivallales bacterium]